MAAMVSVSQLGWDTYGGTERSCALPRLAWVCHGWEEPNNSRKNAVPGILCFALLKGQEVWYFCKMLSVCLVQNNKNMQHRIDVGEVLFVGHKAPARPGNRASSSSQLQGAASYAKPLSLKPLPLISSLSGVSFHQAILHDPQISTAPKQRRYSLCEAVVT